MAFLLVLGLLLQQLSMVAYACAVVQMPPEPAAMVEACAGMGMPQAPDSPALCEKHCNPDPATTGDHVKLGVPALALPPLVHDPLLAHAPSADACHAYMVALERSDPPPRLRYCRLLI
jgi:hypothetical protein